MNIPFDNSYTSEECHTWFSRFEFAENLIEIIFDPDDLATKFHAGMPATQLKHFGFLRMARTSTMMDSADSR